MPPTSAVALLSRYAFRERHRAWRGDRGAVPSSADFAPSAASEFHCQAHCRTSDGLGQPPGSSRRTVCRSPRHWRVHQNRCLENVAGVTDVREPRGPRTSPGSRMRASGAELGAMLERQTCGTTQSCARSPFAPAKFSEIVTGQPAMVRPGSMRSPSMRSEAVGGLPLGNSSAQPPRRQMKSSPSHSHSRSNILTAPGYSVGG